MKSGKLRIFKNRRMSLLHSLLLIVAASLVIWAAMGGINADYAFYFEQCRETISLFFLNWLPVLLAMLLLFCITGHAPASILSISGLCLLMATINDIKTGLRRDPFVPADVGLWREGVTILAGYGAGSIILVVICLLVTILVIVFVCLFWKPVGVRPLNRLTGGIGCLAVSMLLLFTVYTDSDLYNSYPHIGNGNDSEYACKGFFYSFLRDLMTMHIVQPDGYHATDYAALEEGDDQALDLESLQTPHVIMIMSEAFSAISESEHLDFSQSADPLAGYKAAAASSVISGYLAVDISGGGTASTEFASLSGISPVILEMNRIPYDYVRKDTFSLAWFLRGFGYEAKAIHPGAAWFYNRQKVYPYLGFSEFYNLENSFDLETQAKSYGYISEAATFDKIIDTFDTHLVESDDPLFLFTVTIQNHGGYLDKYDLSESSVAFTSDLDLSDTDINILTNYFEGIADACDELTRLLDYLDALDEPVVVVYYGDHQPSLASYDLEDALVDFDEDENYLNGYTTPYLIWQNGAAARSVDLSDNLEASGLMDGEQISSFYLSAALMQLLDFDTQSAYLQYVNEIRVSIPVITWDHYRVAGGAAVETLNEQQQALADTYRAWCYYQLFDKS